jgi:hypothetical protein
MPRNLKNDTWTAAILQNDNKSWSFLMPGIPALRHVLNTADTRGLKGIFASIKIIISRIMFTKWFEVLLLCITLCLAWTLETPYRTGCYEECSWQEIIIPSGGTPFAKEILPRPQYELKCEKINCEETKV